jgi:hypothetical protein
MDPEIVDLGYALFSKLEETPGILFLKKQTKNPLISIVLFLYTGIYIFSQGVGYSLAGKV